MTAKRAQGTTDLGMLDKYSFRDHVLELGRIDKGGKRIVDFFRDVDADRSGEVDKKEFRQALRNMGFISATKAQMDEVFTFCDMDSSGAIAYNELDTLMRKLGKRPPEVAPSALPTPDVAPTEAVVATGPYGGAGRGVGRPTHRMRGRFPKELGDDESFAQPTYVRMAWRRDGAAQSRTGSRASTPRDTDSVWSEVSTSSSSLAAVLNNELSSAPHSSLAAALTRVDGRAKGQLERVGVGEPAQQCLDRSPHSLAESRPYSSRAARPLASREQRKHSAPTMAPLSFHAVPRIPYNGQKKRAATTGGETSGGGGALRRIRIRERLLHRIGVVHTCQL